MQIAAPEDQVQMQGDVSIFDETYERALINIVPEELKGAMLRVKHGHEKYFLLEERDLWKHTQPTEIACILKLSFWDEYNRAQDRGVRMKVSNIIRGACSRDHFDSTVMASDKQLSWIITPPKDYMLSLRALHDRGIQRLTEVLNLPLIEGAGRALKDKKGKVRKDEKGEVVRSQGTPNVRLIGEIFRITQYLDQRIKGAIVQRFAIQQHNVNQNIPPAMDATSLEELETMERRIAISQTKAQNALPLTIDVGENGEEGNPPQPGTPEGSDTP
jgi:hypothetical protein